jgi:ring-1,2-phenylacetyl-CoA epoxidase subunit PaaE
VKIRLPLVPKKLQRQMRRQFAEWVSNPVLLDILGEEEGDTSIKDTGYPARVMRISQETSKSVTVEIALEGGYRLNYRAGQHVCVSFLIGKTWFRRTFSFSSCPEENRITFTVKRILHGRVSSYVAERLRVGERIIIDDPEGDFVLPAESTYDQRYVFLAAGSGIVPVYSMIKDLLGKNALADIALVYCNRTPEEAIFRREIEVAERKHSHLKVIWHYTRRDGYGHDHSRRLTGEKVLALIGDATQANYYVCAPAGLAKSYLETLTAIGVPENRARFELFSAASHVSEAAELRPRTIVFETTGLISRQVSVTQSRVETVLETAASAGINFSPACAGANCRACKLKIVQGSAVMDEPNSLSVDEASSGQVLACVAYPCEDLSVQLPRSQ